MVPLGPGGPGDPGLPLVPLVPLEPGAHAGPCKATLAMVPFLIADADVS